MPSPRMTRTTKRVAPSQSRSLAGPRRRLRRRLHQNRLQLLQHLKQLPHHRHRQRQRQQRALALVLVLVLVLALALALAALQTAEAVFWQAGIRSLRRIAAPPVALQVVEVVAGASAVAPAKAVAGRLVPVP